MAYGEGPQNEGSPKDVLIGSSRSWIGSPQGLHGLVMGSSKLHDALMAMGWGLQGFSVPKAMGGEILVARNGQETPQLSQWPWGKCAHHPTGAPMVIQVPPQPRRCPHGHDSIGVSMATQVPPWPCGSPRNPQNSPRPHCAPQPVSPVILAVKGLPGMCLSSKRTMML